MKWIKDNWLTLLILVFFIISLSSQGILYNLLDGIGRKQRLTQKEIQNIAAENDTLRANIEGGMKTWSKLPFEFNSFREMKRNLSKELSNKIDKLDNKRSITNVTNVTKVYSDTSKKDIPTTVDTVDEDTYTLKWIYSNEDSSRVLSGETTIDIKKKVIEHAINGTEDNFICEEIVGIEPKGTDIIQDQLKMSLLVGIRRNGKNDEIFVVPDNPNVTITGIEGSQIKRKASWIGVRPYVGVGANYNPFNNKLSPGIQAGVGATFYIGRR